MVLQKCPGTNIGVVDAAARSLPECADFNICVFGALGFFGVALVSLFEYLCC